MVLHLMGGLGYNPSQFDTEDPCCKTGLDLSLPSWQNKLACLSMPQSNMAGQIETHSRGSLRDEVSMVEFLASKIRPGLNICL
jgi:hypothetical protein